jgi:hypothetical protein
VSPQLSRLARERGLGLDVLVSSESSVAQALLRRPPRLLVAGPFTAVPAFALAAELPQTLVLTAGQSTGAPQSNLAALGYAPEPAFQEAGRLAAAAGGSCLVGVLAPPGSGAAAAFREGFSAAGLPQRLREREVPLNADRARLRGVIDELHAQGVRLFVVALRALTPQCLELLEGRDSVAVVESQESSGAFADVVQASIEPDWAAAVAAALDRGGDPAPSGGLVLPGRLVVSQRGANGWRCRDAASAAPPP